MILCGQRAASRRIIFLSPNKYPSKSAHADILVNTSLENRPKISSGAVWAIGGYGLACLTRKKYLYWG